jgi:hypothetical protein
LKFAKVDLLRLKNDGEVFYYNNVRQIFAEDGFVTLIRLADRPVYFQQKYQIG